MGQEPAQPPWRQAASHTLHAALVLKAILEERLQEETGMLLADNEALLHIRYCHDSPRMSEIAQGLILSPGGTTKVIDRLEQMGHVVRSPDPTDRRATLVELTASGREAITRNRKIMDAALQEVWKDHVSDDEAGVVLEVMDRVLEATQFNHH